jgi:acyl-CoA thioester hydrolase
VTINLEIIRAKKDYSRWSIQHTILKNNGKIGAILTVDGAWLDTEKRKLISPPPIVSQVFSLMPRNEKFQSID